jgi:hypothetical protein
MKDYKAVLILKAPCLIKEINKKGKCELLIHRSGFSFLCRFVGKIGALSKEFFRNRLEELGEVPF